MLNEIPVQLKLLQTLGINGYCNYDNSVSIPW